MNIIIIVLEIVQIPRNLKYLGIKNIFFGINSWRKKNLFKKFVKKIKKYRNQKLYLPSNCEETSYKFNYNNESKESYDSLHPYHLYDSWNLCLKL